MSLLGKLSINSEQTTFDISTTQGKIYSSFDSNKIESQSGFTSIRTNNCLTSGKWCYEATLLSNGVLQIGFCQLETPFTRVNGVGDDILSMGYDGYRHCVWSKSPTDYGIFWDCGDIIGACIDMEKGEVEYFINGKSYGVAYKKAKKGENVAFFPGISFTEGEKCYFNFGTLPFHYTYSNYEPIDVPKCHYNNNVMVTASMINILNGKVLVLLEDEIIDQHIKDVISFKVFSYLIKYSFKDSFLCKMYILPFMIKLSKDNEKSFKTFINYLLKVSKILNYENFFSELIDFICNLIEEYSVMISRKDNANFYNQYTSLLFEILKNKEIVNEWRKDSNLYYLSLRNFFSGNTYYMNDIYINAVNNCNINLLPASAVLNKLINLNVIENDSTKKYDLILINTQMKLFDILFEYCPSLFAKEFFNLIQSCYKINNLKKFYSIDYCIDEKNKKNRKCIKNVIYPIIKYSLQELTKIPLTQFSVSHFSGINDHMGSLSFFYNEKPIGGSDFEDVREYYLNSMTLELEIPNEKNQFLFNLFIRVLSPMEKMIKTFFKLYKHYELKKIEDFSTHDHGDISINMLMRTFFYLFNDQDLTMLIEASNFLIEWLSILLSKNKNNLAAFTQSVISFPIEVCKIVLYKTSEFPFLQEDKINLYINNIFSFYITLLKSDESNNIQHFRVKEDNGLMKIILKAISILLKDKTSKMIILKNVGNISILMETVLPLLDNKELEKYIIKIIGNIRHTLDTTNKMINVNAVKTYFSNSENLKIINDFLTHFSSLVNEKMTSYINNLENCTDNIIKANYVCNNKEILCQYLKHALVSMSTCINVYSFIIEINSTIFFDNKNSLISIQFRMFLKNLASRIINEPYIGYIIDLSQHTSCLRNDVKRYVLFPIIEMFLNMKSQSNFDSFNQMIIQNDEIFIQPFIDLPHKFKLSNYSKEFEVYNKIVTDIKEKKHLHNKESIRTLSIDSKNEDKLCILCYNNIANKKIIPCGHVACEECLSIYMLTKSICFICHGQIKSIDDSNI